MNIRLAICAALCSATGISLAAPAAEPLFPAVTDLEPALKMPEGASFEIGPDGNFLVDGRPRFLLGTLYYLAFSDKTGLEPGPGYAPEDAWIYESPPTRDYLQRLGFDAAGGEVSTSWMRKYRPEPGFKRAGRLVDWDFATNFWHSGLPCILDLSAAVWSHGGLPFDKRRGPPARAFVDDPHGPCHFISYSLVTDEGRDVWRTFWRTGAEELRAHGARPFAYELFNEPRYDDRSPGAREAFAAFLSDKFGGDPAAMDAAWGSSFGSFEAAAAFEKTGVSVGLGVEWLKFREAAFEGGVKLGIETIREVDPDARFCFQPLARAADLDRVLGAEKHCQVVMTQTGGDDLWENLRLLALADGKPLVDGETYFRNSRASHRGKLVRHFAMGLDATYYFKWERRLSEVSPRNEEGLARLFERYPWLGLNPVGTPPAALAGLMDGKRDIAAVQDLFCPRGRGLPPARRVAVLSSRPTARLAEAAGLRCHALEREAALALAVGAHVPVDAIFEEQLPEGRLDRYKVLVAAGVAATYPATRGILRDWVERGGALILVGEAMELDEYARPQEALDRTALGFPGITLGDSEQAEARPFAFRGHSWDAVPYRRSWFAYATDMKAEFRWNQLVVFPPHGRAALNVRRIGNGRLYYLGARFSNPGDEGRLLAALAADCGVLPTCATLDPATGEPVDDIEVHAARGADGAVGYIVENRSLAPRVVRFLPRSPDGRAPSRPERGSGGAEPPVLADVSRRVILGPDKEGAVLLLLEPNVPVVLRGATTQAALEAALASAPRAWNEGAPAWDTQGKTHAESAESKSHAESAESKSHAESAESKSHAESAESKSHAENAENAEVRGGGASSPSEPSAETGGEAAHSAFSIQHSALTIEPYSEVERHAAEWLAAHTSASRARAKAFSVDPARVKFLNLRDAATVPYGDKVADDGKGGWTDQGENCLENAPWGVTDCNGVPFDFIRPDQNGERAAVVLRSTRQPWLPEAARGIRADVRAEALWFLHAGAFLDPGKEAFRYVVRYADGTSVLLPMRGYVEFDDWWMHGAVPGGRDAMACKPGWLNAKSRGFHVWRWENPFPEKTIATIDIESANTKTAPIVEAITAELARGDLMAIPVPGAPKLRPWGDTQAGDNVVSDNAVIGGIGGNDGIGGNGGNGEHLGFVNISFSSARPWAGCSIQYPQSVEVPDSASRADLEFLLTAPDLRPLPPLQLRIGKNGGYVALDSFLRETGLPGTWRVSFPLDLAEEGLRAPFREFSLQLRGERPEGAAAAVSVSCVRILADGGPEESPLALRRLLAKGSHGVEAIRRDGGIELAVDDRTEDWGLGRLSPVRAVPLPEDPATAVLAFDVNGGRTPLGRRDTGRQRFRVQIECECADGTRRQGDWVRDPPVEDGPVDDDPNSWQTVRIPLAKLLPEGATAIGRFTLQYTGLPATGRAGLLVRDFRFE